MEELCNNKKDNCTVNQIHFDNAVLSDISVITEFVESELEKAECPMKTVIQFNVAVDELCSNIIRYAYGSGSGPVTVKMFREDNPPSISISFIDSGIPYNPLAKADPDITLSAEEREIGGLGIYMVKKTMDNIIYKYENNQNILTIIKNI